MATVPQPERRRLLQLAGGCALGLCAPGMVLARTALTDYPFALGVASGSPAADSVVLWTRLVQRVTFPLDAAVGPLTVLWEMADDDGFTKVVRRGRAQAVPELGHSVHAEVAGLAPDRWYFYRFLLGDAVSPVGRTRTVPLPEARPGRLRLAYASCQKWEDGYFCAWRHMRDEGLDAVVFLGDYIYEYPGASGRLRSPGGGWVIRLPDYRRRYAVYKSDPDLQAMHQSCPWLMAWDDHEVQNDHAGLQAGFGGRGDPASPADFVARRNAAYQAYYEHMPLRASALARALAAPGGADALRLHERVQFGRLVSLHLLDCRQYRDPQACTPGGRRGSAAVEPQACAGWTDPARTLLGAQQERWLEQSLGAAQTRETRWNVLAQATLFGQRDLRPGPGAVLSNDTWDGYPAARARLTDTLERHAVPNPVILGGDIHANWVGHVLRDPQQPDSGHAAVEFCGTSITSRGPGNGRQSQLLAENPHCVFSDGREHGYGVAEFTASGLTTRLRVVGDVQRQDAGIATLASFSVDPGRSIVQRA